MATIASYLKRPTAIMKMPTAIAAGMSPTAFLRQLHELGLSYRKTTFLSDWRNVKGTEVKKDRLKYVRRDRRPPMAALADVDWEMTQEYMYKTRVWVRTRPGEPLEERFVNIMSDDALTPMNIEEEVFDRWKDTEKYGDAALEKVQVIAGWHKMGLA